MSDIRKEQDKDQIITLTFDAEGQAANTMNAAFRSSLSQITKELLADKDSIKGIILTSAKSTFFAGGDLRELSQLEPGDADKVFAMVEAIKADLRILEKLGVPVVQRAFPTAALRARWRWLADLRLTWRFLLE